MSRGHAPASRTFKRRPPSEKEQERRKAQGKMIGEKSAAAYRALTKEQ